MNKHAGVAVFANNNILLAKRIEFYKGQLIPYAGYWSVFCGLVEDGESLEDAAERELFEESELTIEKPLSPIGSLDQLTLFATEFDDLVYPKLNFEHTECGWFNLKVLNSFPYKIDEKIVRLILNYKNIV